MGGLVTFSLPDDEWERSESCRAHDSEPVCQLLRTYRLNQETKTKKKEPCCQTLLLIQCILELWQCFALHLLRYASKTCGVLFWSLEARRCLQIGLQ